MTYTKRVLAMMEEGPITVEDVVIELGLPYRNASSVLCELYKRKKVYRRVFRRTPNLVYLYAPEEDWL